MSLQHNVFERGTTRSGTERPHLLGRRGRFDDVSAPGGYGTQQVLSGMEVETIVVKNDSGGALSPKKLVKWKAGGVGTLVGAVTSAGDRVAGVVDPFLTADVPNGSMFHLIVKGPTTVLAHDNAITAGIGLVSQGSGRADGYTINGDADDALAYFGVSTQASSAQDASIRVVIDCGI